MYYPTIQHNATRIVHVIDNQSRCMCGMTYNSFYEMTRRDLRNIKFKPISEVSCQTCLEKLRETAKKLEEHQPESRQYSRS